VELDFFERVIALAKQYDVLVVHDLAYADIVYDGWKAPSIMQVPGAKDIAVEFFTLSKSYNMAGWRIGFMVGNPELVNALARIKSYHDYGTFTPLQVAAIAALEGDQQCVRDIAEQYASAVTCWSKACTSWAGWSRIRRRRCTSGRRFPRLMRIWARWSLPRSCWPKPRSVSRRGWVW
jgi:alanine-synthesizing transaminase